MVLKLFCADWFLRAGFTLAELWDLSGPCFGCVICGTNWVVRWCALKQAIGVLVLRHLRGALEHARVSRLCLDQVGAREWSAVGSCLFFLEVPGRGYAVKWGQLPLLLEVEPLSKRHRAHGGQLLLVCRPLRDFVESTAWAQTACFCGLVSWGSGQDLYWVRSDLRESTGQGESVVVQINGDSDLTPSFAGRLRGDGGQQRNNGTPGTLVQGVVAPLSLPWSQTIQFLPICAWHFPSFSGA